MKGPMTSKKQMPTDEEIAVRAYHLWESEGRSHGRDWEYWLRAKEELTKTQQIQLAQGVDAEQSLLTSRQPRSATRATSKKRVSAPPGARRNSLFA